MPLNSMYDESMAKRVRTLEPYTTVGGTLTCCFVYHHHHRHDHRVLRAVPINLILYRNEKKTTTGTHRVYNVHTHLIGYILRLLRIVRTNLFFRFLCVRDEYSLLLTCLFVS